MKTLWTQKGSVGIWLALLEDEKKNRYIQLNVGRLNLSLRLDEYTQIAKLFKALNYFLEGMKD